MPSDFVVAVAAPPAVVVVAFPLPAVVLACVVGAAFPCEIYIEFISSKVHRNLNSPPTSSGERNDFRELLTAEAVA
jgi:hypothetical protein